MYHYLHHFQPTARQRAVLDKYGWQTIDRLIDRAQRDYWKTIHSCTVGLQAPDMSQVDIDETLLDATLEYIYLNDEELSAEEEN